MPKDRGDFSVSEYWRHRIEYVAQRLRPEPAAPEAIFFTLRDLNMLAELAARAVDPELVGRLRALAEGAARRGRTPG